MSSNASKRLLPKLRFPEFRSDGNWAAKAVADLCIKITQGGTPDTSNSEYWGGDIEWLTPSEMGKSDTRFISSTGRKITNKGLENCSSELLPKNSVIISTRAPIGHLAINRLPMAINQGCKGLIPARSTNAGFLYYSLFISKRALLDLGAGNTFKELTGASLKAFKVNVPKRYEEQKKIADCLSFIDDFITAEAKKIEAIKAHKKGLMQLLFPAEGETVPRLRFPEFREAGEWEEKQAGTLFANRIEQGEVGLPIYSVTMNDGMIKRSLLDRDFDDVAEPEGNKKAHKHDIAYNMMRMWQGASGVAVEDCMVSPAYVILAPQNGVYSIFFGYLFKLPRYLRMLASHSQGITLDRLRLYYKDFASILLRYPAISEQKKIADCLSSLDELIAAHSQKLETLKAHKKGLMQGLFPSLAEDKA